MTFGEWHDKLLRFQRGRDAAIIQDPQAELSSLKTEASTLVAEGVDIYAGALALLTLEEATMCVEARLFDKARSLALAIEVDRHRSPLFSAAIRVNKELILGNVLLLGHNDHEGAIPHYQKAVAAVGPGGVVAAANAAMNLSHCQSVLRLWGEAVASIERAAALYQQGGRPDKRALVKHALGNALRNADRPKEAFGMLMNACDEYKQDEHEMGQWSALDDVTRTCLTLAVEDASQKDQWLEMAHDSNGFANLIASKIWERSRKDEGRLSDLSE